MSEETTQVTPQEEPQTPVTTPQAEAKPAVKTYSKQEYDTVQGKYGSLLSETADLKAKNSQLEQSQQEFDKYKTRYEGLVDSKLKTALTTIETDETYSELLTKPEGELNLEQKEAFINKFDDISKVVNVIKGKTETKKETETQPEHLKPNKPKKTETQRRNTGGRLWTNH